MKVAVASGKGGAGKTLLAATLAGVLAENGHPVAYVDADVEAPDGDLFLHPRIDDVVSSHVAIPAPVAASCSGCGNCQSICAFSAIAVFDQTVHIFDRLCHACGACLLVCSEHGLVEHRRRIGVIEEGTARGMRFFAGRLDVGEARAKPLIEDLLATAGRRAPDALLIVDAPPGTGCPVAAVVEAVDRVILVTEPTPSGLHDLAAAVNLCAALQRTPLIVINRCDLCDADVDGFAAEHQLRIAGRIPFSTAIARAGAEGALVPQECPPLLQTARLLAGELLAEGGFP
jgi:MinD superfamily P-loop ATPase